MNDMMGLFDMDAGQNDMMNGFAGLNMAGGSQPPPPQQQLHGGESSKKTNEDLLGMF